MNDLIYERYPGNLLTGTQVMYKLILTSSRELCYSLRPLPSYPSGIIEWPNAISPIPRILSHPSFDLPSVHAPAALDGSRIPEQAERASEWNNPREGLESQSFSKASPKRVLFARQQRYTRTKVNTISHLVQRGQCVYSCAVV